MSTSVLWLGRDLRRADHPAFALAASGGPVVPLYVIDPAERGGRAQRAWLAATLLSLADSLDGALCVRQGDPARLVAEVAREAGARTVHATEDFTPDGARRQALVAESLGRDGRRLVLTGSAYAVRPGGVHTSAGQGYKVFGGFERAWRDHPLDDAPVPPGKVEPVAVGSDQEALARLLAWRDDGQAALPRAGEVAGLDAWHEFLTDGLEGYADDRDRADLAGTSRLSAYLALGVLHPRTLLADLRGRTGAGAAAFVRELAWREFYADVLWRHPASLDNDLVPTLAGMAHDLPGEHFDAWRAGRTGYPLVDAGMRQLLGEGWLPNRVRMVVASFLLKDLHLPWQDGARHFREHLIDYDPASNTHNWQWLAGTGTDTAPYHRVFNPVLQSSTADPSGEYVRAHVPELAHLPGRAAPTPWDSPDGYSHGYPRRILDHAEERARALERYRLAVGR